MLGRTRVDRANSTANSGKKNSYKISTRDEDSKSVELDDGSDENMSIDRFVVLNIISISKLHDGDKVFQVWGN